MSEDTRESATCGDSLLPKSNTTESHDTSAGLDDVVDEKKALASPEVKAEVKFAAADSQNGDAILDIENVRAAFSGMGKEELMKFANDPFWVRTRWVLFVSFWVLWVAMVAGAVAIIVLAPKCAPPKPRRWWEQGALFSIDSLSGGKDLSKVEAVDRYLNNLKKVGADAVVLPPLMSTGSSNNPEAVIDFKTIRPDFGTLEDVKKTFTNLKQDGVRVILEISPGHTSKEHEWFKQSALKVDRFKDYYIWVDSSVKGGLTAPNKWGADWNDASFVWSDQRGAFYVRQSSSDLPVLNLTNPEVQAQFQDILRFWLDLGVSGFQIRHASSFYVNERWINQPKDVNDLPDTVSLIKQWHAAITNHTEDNVLILQDDLQLSPNKTSANLSDILSSPISLSTLRSGFTAQDLKNKIEVAVNESAKKWPLWDFPEDQIKVSTLPPGLIDGLLMTSMLLPGTPIIHDGTLLDLSKITGSPGDSAVGGDRQQLKTPSQFRAEIFKELISVRKNMVAVNFGATNITLVNGTDNVTVFTFTRIKSGNPGILVVVNPTNDKTTVNLTGLNKVPDELSVNSIGYRSEGENMMLPKNKLSATEVKLAENSAVVFTFVPKKES